jgi:hypothetical protein
MRLGCGWTGPRLESFSENANLFPETGADKSKRMVAHMLDMLNHADAGTIEILHYNQHLCGSISLS